jgi:hypothetical protein
VFFRECFSFEFGVFFFFVCVGNEGDSKACMYNPRRFIAAPFPLPSSLLPSSPLHHVMRDQAASLVLLLLRLPRLPSECVFVYLICVFLSLSRFANTRVSYSPLFLLFVCLSLSLF